jgi:hypothetical protein
MSFIQFFQKSENLHIQIIYFENTVFIALTVCKKVYNLIE